MFPLSPEEIQSLDADCPERLAALDDSGLFPGPRETAEEFRERLLYQQQAFAELDRELAERGEAEAFEGVVVRADCRIPDEIVEEAAECTRSLYGFSGRHVPGFFLSQGVGPLWGGCAIGDTESGLTVFLIRSSFRARRRWFVYDRRELLAHELCHAARQCLGDLPLEEYFAYQTSPSRLRRYLGNCFIRERDALLFLLPVLLLPIVQTVQAFWLPGLPVWPFVLLAAAYPVFLLCRNQLSRNQLWRARQKLAGWGVPEALPILFRMTTGEIAELGALPDAAAFSVWLRRKTAAELRWQLIATKYLARFTV